MIYDRPYMQDDFRPKQAPVLKWIILITIAVFVLQFVFEAWFRSVLLMDFFALSAGQMNRFFIWTLVSYAFLHAFPLHIIGNLLIVFFIGREIAPLLGAKRFVQFYLVSAAVAGAAWLIVDLVTGTGGSVIGASGSALALLTLFACIYPNKPITLLLFFIIPVTVKPKYIAYFILAFSLFGLLFLELPPGSTDQIAHSAHLGGMLTGWLYFHFVFGKPPKLSSKTRGVEPPAWFQKRKTRSASKASSFSVNITNRKVLQEEVDRILDKINSKGFGSLSEEEKRLLERAKDLLNK